MSTDHFRWVRFFGKALGMCLVLFSVVILAGVSWNLFEQKRLLAHNPPPGRLYTVNGKSMHLYCSGTGRPTIVAEAGSGEDSLTWTLVQESLSDTYRFCSYDRAGAGWSEPQPGARDAQTISRQLHELLEAAHEQGPYVLIGHSLGGLYIKEYAQQYPKEVKSLVFIDATTPETYEGKAADAVGLSQAALRQLTAFPFLAWAAEVSGYARLTHQCSDYPPPLYSVRALYRADQCIPSQDAEQRKEGLALAADEQEVTDKPVNVPVLVLSEDKSPILHTTEAFTAWNALQNNLLKLSPESYRVIALNSDHFLPVDCPRFTSDQIRRFLELNQDGSDPFGTTTSAPCR